MYVYTDGAIDNTHPIRRSVWTAFPWLLIHLPMSAGLLIGGHVSAYATNHPMETAHRWLWGGGLGLGMLAMWVLAQLFRDDDPPGKLLMPKVRQHVLLHFGTLWKFQRSNILQQIRVLPRLLAAIIYALLPLASEEHLSETALISAGAGISAFVVIFETIGSLERGASIVESWKGKVATFDTVVDIGSRRRENDQTHLVRSQSAEAAEEENGES